MPHPGRVTGPPGELNMKGSTNKIEIGDIEKLLGGTGLAAHRTAVASSHLKNNHAS